MGPQTNDIYEELYKEYTHELTGEDKELAHKVKALVDDLVDELDLSERLRPDAKLYLLVNYHRLLVIPLVRSKFIDTKQIFDSLKVDAKLALNEARAIADRRKKDRISGHVMVDSIGKVWDRSLLLAEQDERGFGPDPRLWR